MPERYGGGGGDFLHEAIVIEELALLRAHALQTSLHTGICMPYLLHYANDDQKQRFLRPAITGDCLLAIAMTEPGTGSDLAGDRDARGQATATTTSSTAQRRSSRTASTATS